MGLQQAVTPVDEVASLFRSDLPLEAKLETARTELLDLSARNRLLNTPRSSKTSRTIEIVDERSTEIFRLLVREERAFTFLAGRASNPQQKDAVEDEPDEIADLAQPEDDEVDDRGQFARHTDTRLQTRLTSKGLQKRLLDLYSDAITLEQEQGVNILYLALGMLRWVDPKNAANIRYAPLILVPVALERTSASDKFKLKWRHEEQAANLSLEAYLDREHMIRLPPFESGEDFDPALYLAAVGEAVAAKPGWEVLTDDIVLGFFSFSKFLMYRDLEPACWPDDARLATQPLLRSLLTEGFAHIPEAIPDDAPIDGYIKARALLHVADSDSSQTVAVHEARAGRNLVIQGPPGTGKSQTIANIIASAVADGKTVLFVAEKMVALGVVKSRLDRAGVGDACLELHSNKANKRLLLDELRRTWSLGSPRGEFPSALNENLQQETDTLNLHAAALHREHPHARLTPYQVVGELATLAGQGRAPVDYVLEGAAAWTPDDLRRRQELLDEYAQRVLDMGPPHLHPWSGIGLSAMLPTDVDRLVRRIADLRQSLATLADERNDLARLLGQTEPDAMDDFARIAVVAQRVASAPKLSAKALGAQAWKDSTGVAAIDALLAEGAQATSLTGQLAPALLPVAWQAAVANDVQRLAASLPLFTAAPESVARLHRIVKLLPHLLTEADQLNRQLGLPATAETFPAIQHILRIAELLVAAPDASPEAFAAAVWEHSPDRAEELAEAATMLEASRAAVASQCSAAAWETDLTAARQTLASHGDGLLRRLSGEWRAADRLARSFLADPKLPLAELLALLDHLTLGRKARATLQTGDAIGREAFGSWWRGDRSASAPLLALVAWMRSLGAVAAATRTIAARLPDRQTLAPAAKAVQHSLAELQPLLAAMRHAATQASLADVLAELQPIAEAERRTASLLVHPAAAMPERVALLDKLTTLQNVRARMEEASELGRQAFDESWHGADSDWPALATAAAWIKANLDILAVAASLTDRDAPRLHAEASRQTQALLLPLCEQLFRDLQADPATLAIDLAGIAAASLAAILERMDLWLRHPEQLSQWVGYRACDRRARDLGLGEIAARLSDGRVVPADAPATLAMAYYEALLRDQFRTSPELAHFEGQIQTRNVQRFTALDRERIAASALEVVHAHHRSIPPGGGLGPVGILRVEMHKKAKHLKIRQLMEKAAPAIQALKPVLMMSPLSVAQFLPPGKLTFDLLVMDEASQIQPVDALGAIARCRQVIVVGDERQLPPTRFFAKMTSNSDADEDDEDTTRVGDIESILGLFIARGLPQRMLRWHYRSRHESLIAVSNSEFYENRLFIIPSPFTAEAGMGLRFRYVEDGVFYSESKSSETLFANPIEARAVAEAVMRHALEQPHLTLGVATFSMKQRRAIQDQLEHLRRLNPVTEAFFHAHPGEPFFIKNLENVQGDERDVILISVGYGRDTKGNFAMRFGPLGQEGGERRLNVLISRARQQCEVFASITDEDIDVERAKGKGVFALKLFLHFARTGRLDMTRTPRTAQSPNVFAAQIATALQQRGYQVHPHVGIAGCFLDLAVVDPERPGRYVLGIECDGPSYQSARSARDRDRLRQAVLEDHGWILHRVWSIDWLHRPQEQLERVVRAIQQAKEQLAESAHDAAQRTRAMVEIVTVEREGTVEMGLGATVKATATTLYVEAVFPCPAATELHDTPTGLLADLVQRIVHIESPIHRDEVLVRVRGIWGLQRSGARIQAAMEHAIAAALAGLLVEQVEHILLAPQKTVTVRDRSQVSSPSLRKPEMLPPQELEAAVVELVTISFGAREEEIARAVSRMLGYAATSAPLRTAILQAVESLARRETIVRRGDLLVLA